GLVFIMLVNVFVSAPVFSELKKIREALNCDLHEK
ncbi:MAG: hypothetical protein ACI8PT_004642, partial [Gammaproteobacteria bacterium]